MSGYMVWIVLYFFRPVIFICLVSFHFIVFIVEIRYIAGAGSSFHKGADMKTLHKGRRPSPEGLHTLADMDNGVL